MERRIYSSLILALSVATLTACGGGGGGSSSPSSPGDPGGGNNPGGSTVTQRPLNDTGINTAGTTSNSSNLVACGQTSYTAPGSNVAEQIRHPQDCDQGRDATANDDSDGNAGFSFTKLDDSGNDLPANATVADDDWECVRDEVTGLTWEVKSPYASNQRYYDYTFTWYSSDVSAYGGEPGTRNGGICSGGPVSCDTEGYVTFINDTLPGGLCGLDDGWRMPTREELHGLHDYGDKNGSGISQTNPSVDTDYFPYTMSGATQSGIYWSGSTYAGGLDLAWRSFFGVADGPGAADKNIAMRVRLVHD